MDGIGTSKQLFINDILKNINPAVELDDLANDFLLEFADDFIDLTTSLAAEFAKNKGQMEINESDIEFVLRRKFGDALFNDSSKSNNMENEFDFIPNERHNKRMEAIQSAQNDSLTD